MNIIEMIENLAVGDVFYEQGFGVEKLIVETEPVRRSSGAWTWLATNSRGNTVNFLVNENHLGYAPNIFLKEDTK